MRRVFFIDIDRTITGKNGSILHDTRGNPTTLAASALVSLFENSIQPVFISSRSYAQMKEVSRLLGITDFISDFGAVIQVNGEKIQLADEKAAERFKSEFLPGLLNHFKGYLEKHEPWFENARFTVMLRGCLRIDGEYLLKRVNDYLLQNGFQTWHMVDNGSTRRKTTLMCDEVRIYHIMQRSISKLIAARKYLETSGSDALVFAAGDSPADLELAGVSKHFLFVGTEEELDTYEKYIDFPVNRAKITVLNCRGPEAFDKAVRQVIQSAA